MAAMVMGALLLAIVSGSASLSALQPPQGAGEVLATHNDPAPAPVPALTTPELLAREVGFKCILFAFQTGSYRSRHTFEEHVWKADLPSVYSISPPGRPPGQFNPVHLASPKPGDLNFKDPAQRGSGPAQDFPCTAILKSAGFSTGGF